MIKLAQELPSISKNSRMLLQVHDELVFEVPEKEVSNVAKQVLEIMEHVEKVGVTIDVEAKAGDNWEEMSPV
jgi:DNA polymerase-1